MWDELTAETTDQKQAGVLSRHPATPEEVERTTIEARPVQEAIPDSAQLAREQTEGSGAIATIYSHTDETVINPRTNGGRKSGTQKIMPAADFNAVEQTRSSGDPGGNK